MTVNGEVQKYIVQHKDAPIMNTEMEKRETERQKVEIKRKMNGMKELKRKEIIVSVFKPNYVIANKKICLYPKNSSACHMHVTVTTI